MPLGGGAIVDHTSVCGVRLSRRCLRSVDSDDSLTSACAWLSEPRRRSSVDADHQRYPRTAGHAYVLLPTGAYPRTDKCTRLRGRRPATAIPHRRTNAPTDSRPNDRPPPSGLGGGRFRAGAGFQPAVLVRESNPRQPDSWSGALPTELTKWWSTQPSLEPIHGTHFTNR